MNIDRVKKFLEKNKIEYLQKEKLCKHSSVKIGGYCSFFVLPKDMFEVIKLIEYIKKNKIRFYILGNGTNTLFSDNGFEGIVICTKHIKNYQIKENKIYAECGLGLFEFNKICANNGLSGLEFSYGIPGSVGGAVITNAGAFEKSIGQFVEFVRVYQNGEIKDYSQSEMNFGYRTSLAEKSEMVVLGVQFCCQKLDVECIKKTQMEYFSKKLMSQPYDKLSLGSVFKRNTNFEPVSKLIDGLGLKGYKIGDAEVSKKHAGFFINNGECTCKDFVLLIKYTQQKIFENFGFEPELEIKLAGDIYATFWGLSHSHDI